MMSTDRDSESKNLSRVSPALSRGRIYLTNGLKDIVTVEIDAPVFS